MALLTAAQWHARRHNRDLAFYNCAKCLSQYGVCRKKVRYRSADDARRAGDWLYVMRKAEAPLAPYRCRICFRWHLTTARGARLKRSIKRYRRSRWRDAH